MNVDIGISPCPNDIYIFAGLLLGETDSGNLDLHFQFEDVETLNRCVQSGSLDAAKISCANYSRVADNYEMLDCGGAIGRGVGPLLLTNGVDFDRSAPILVPGEFTTANFLLDFYLRESAPSQKSRKRFMPFDVLYEELLNRSRSQGVVIHEKRFTYQQDGLTLVQDLGDFWETQTGFPIPLGALVSRRSLNIASELAEAVRRSLQWSGDNVDRAYALCREHSQDMNPAVIRAHIDLYVNQYSMRLETEGEAAIAYFLERQREFAQ